MGTYRPFQTSYWQDSFVLTLTPEEKYFYMYLITNPKTNICGIYEFPMKLAEVETGYNRETIEKLLNKFENSYNRIVYSKETNEVCIVNWFKYNFNKSPKVRIAIEEAFEKVKNKKLIQYLYGIDTLPVSTVYVTDTDSVINSSLKEEKTKENDHNEKSIQYQLANMLYQSILKNDGKFKKPDLDKWAIHVDRMMRIDERSEEEIKSVIQYATTNDFWKSNILSTSKLREKFTTLVIQMKRGEKDGINKQSNSGNKKTDWDIEGVVL